MVQCCAPGLELMWNQRSLPKKICRQGSLNSNSPNPTFTAHPGLSGGRQNLSSAPNSFHQRPAVSTHLPRQNWLKMESNKSSTEVLPTTSPKAVNATRSSKATNSRVCWFSSPEQVWSTASRARSSAR